MPAKCRMEGCDEGEGLYCIDYTFLAEKNGLSERLHKIIKPYCLECAAGVIAALQLGMPPELFLRLTIDMVQAGYTVQGAGWTAVATRIEEASKGEYVPAPGKCHFPGCGNDATVKPVLIIPMTKPTNGEAYSSGDGYCQKHIQDTLSLSKIDPGAIRVACLKIATMGYTPDILHMRVEARLLEWNPPGVMITQDASEDARRQHIEAHKRKAENAHNN